MAWCLHIVIICITTLSPGDGKAFGHWDKIAHFLLYFLLSIPITLLQPKGWKLYSGLFFSILMGISIEYIQQYIPGRNFEVADIFANSLGSISGIILTLIYYNKNTMNKTSIFFLLLVTLLLSCNTKQEIHSELQIPETGYNQEDTFQTIIDSALLTGSILIYSSKEDVYFSNDFEAAEIGDLPASTFKIPNSIIGLETGVIENEESIFEWDGEKRLFKSWEKTMNLKEAYRVSCLPCYQDLGARIGSEKMKAQIQKINYPQMDVDSGNVHQFWVRGNSAISQLEQIDFLRRLYNAELPIKESTYTTMKNIMLLEEGEGYDLYGKTGWSNQDDDNIGWFVGYLEKNGTSYFFATKIRPQPSFDMDNFIRIRKKVTMEAFRALGFL